MPSPSSALLLRGSLITLRRKCGKATCRCAGKEGRLHESPALSCNFKGRSYTITMTQEEVPLVQVALERHRKEQERLANACMAGMKWLQERVKASRKSREH